MSRVNSESALSLKKAGDENLVDLFARMIAALNDSGFLIYLQPISKDNPGAKVIDHREAG